MSLELLQGTWKRFTGLFIGTSVFMIVMGLLAIALPLAAGIGVSILVSWLIFLTGLAHLVYAFCARGVAGFLWRLILGIVYIVGGLYLALHPPVSLIALTLVLAVILFAEGLMQIFAWFSLRTLPGARWMLFDGFFTFLLGLMILLSWPSGSAWVIGTLVGINFLFSGCTRLGYAGTVRRATP
jgi:uncharacterized membrane protein HdeD (DUF308 family)